MADDGRLERVDRPRELLAVANVELREVRVRGHVRPDACGEVVDDEHLVSLFEQAVGDVRADEARAARDDRPLHRADASRSPE
jgi:hypothetical protein